jgi:hypothetical protein
MHTQDDIMLLHVRACSIHAPTMCYAMPSTASNVRYVRFRIITLQFSACHMPAAKKWSMLAQGVCRLSLPWPAVRLHMYMLRSASHRIRAFNPTSAMATSILPSDYTPSMNHTKIPANTHTHIETHTTRMPCAGTSSFVIQITSEADSIYTSFSLGSPVVPPVQVRTPPYVG